MPTRSLFCLGWGEEGGGRVAKSGEIQAANLSERDVIASLEGIDSAGNTKDRPQRGLALLLKAID